MAPVVAVEAGTWAAATMVVAIVAAALVVEDFPVVAVHSVVVALQEDGS